MNDKFTIRDFFAYFLCGSVFFIELYFAEFNKINDTLYSQRENIKDYATLLIFSSLPITYFAGQIIQSIDTVFYAIGQKLWQSNKKEPTYFKKYCYLLFAGHRTSGILNLRKIRPKEYWKKCNELELVSKYGHAEYWYIMNDLFKGVTLISVFFSFYTLLNCNLSLGTVFLLISLLFWYRARYYAVIFIDTVYSTREALDLIKVENVKS